MLPFLQNTYEALLQQEDEGHTNTRIQFVLSYFCEGKQCFFSDLTSVLKALSLDQLINGITFKREKGAVFTFFINYFYIHVYNTSIHPHVNIQTVVQEAR